MFLLLLSIVVLCLGPWLLRSPVLTRFESFWSGFVTASLVGLMGALVLPHALQDGGPGAAVMAILGFVFPWVVEHWAFDRHHVDRTHGWVTIAGFVGLAIHSISDGVALVERQGKAAATLALAVVLHQFPMGLIIARTLRGRARVMVLAMTASAFVVGYALGSSHTAWLAGRSVALLEGFVAGTLMHVAIPSHAPRPASLTPGNVLGVLAGCGCVLGLWLVH